MAIILMGYLCVFILIIQDIADYVIFLEQVSVWLMSILAFAFALGGYGNSFFLK